MIIKLTKAFVNQRQQWLSAWLAFKKMKFTVTYEFYHPRLNTPLKTNHFKTKCHRRMIAIKGQRTNTIKTQDKIANAGRVQKELNGKHHQRIHLSLWEPHFSPSLDVVFFRQFFFLLTIIVLVLRLWKSCINTLILHI